MPLGTTAGCRRWHCTNPPQEFSLFRRLREFARSTCRYRLLLKTIVHGTENALVRVMVKRKRANSATMVGRRLHRAAIAMWLAALVQRSAFGFAEGGTLLRLLEDVYLSTAKEDFNGHSVAFDDAVAWHRERLYQGGRSGAHIACAEYGDGLRARSSLDDFLGSATVRPLTNHKEHGTCFIATASPAQARSLLERPAAYGLSLFFLLPSVLKLAPGLLDHGNHDEAGPEPVRLQTTYGDRVQMTNNVHGLSLVLSPGLLPADDISSSDQFISSLQESLMSRSIDLHAANFWSDPDMVDGHQARPEGSLRAREWTRAAHMVHQLSSTEGPGPGDICSWGDLTVYHADDDTLIVTGNKGDQSRLSSNFSLRPSPTSG